MIVIYVSRAGRTRDSTAALAGRRRSSSCPICQLCSLTAFLHITADELLGVLLQDGVDLVEQVVHVVGDLGVPLGDLRVGLGGDVLDLFVALALAGLRLTASVTGCHRCPPSAP